MKGLIKNLKSSEQPKKKVTKKKVEAAIPIDVLNLETSLVNAIDGKLEAANGTSWKQSNSFAPSSTSPCPRFYVYRFRGYNQEISFLGQTKRIFDLGNRIEDAVGEMLDDIGILRDSQIEFTITDPAPVRGFIDFMVDWDGLKPMECKSINEAGFVYRKAYHKPTDAHFKQLQLYIYAMKTDSGFLIYYSKNNSELLPILVKRDDVFLEKTFDKFAKIHKVFTDGDLPERPYKKESQNCTRCDAFSHCWSDTELGVSIKPPKEGVK